ncbi:MAG: NAD(+) diphosphatase [Steroidobacteraceae bacterium]
MDFELDSPTFFSGPYVDRRSEAREVAAWLSEALANPRTLYVVSHGTAQLMHDDTAAPAAARATADRAQAAAANAAARVAFLTGDQPIVRAAEPDELVLLGWFQGDPCVLVDLGADHAPPPGTRFEELRPLSSRLERPEAALLAYVRALSIWRARNRFCSVCGSPTRPDRAGHVLRCSNVKCAHEIFPRIDPAIIVLVTDGERALLGRQPTWPAGRYSTIAGFVEPGESLEDAVVREVLEETGVRVRRVDYRASQPWPFPSSLMLGFHAMAAPGAEIRIGGELDDVRWFSREELAAGTPILPPVHAISFSLIAAWFDAGSSVPLATLRPW